MKKWLAFLLGLILLVPACGLGEAPISWLYSFSAGEVLAGDKMDGIREFLDAVQVRLTVQEQDGVSAGRAELLSYGKSVFSLHGELTGEGDMRLYCSLTGDNTLICRKDQLNDFFSTVLHLLEKRSVLKGSAVEQGENLAGKASDLLLRAIENPAVHTLQIGINPNALLDQISTLTDEEDVQALDGTDPECPGAVSRRTWRLTETELNALADTAVTKLKSIPLLGSEFEKGSVRIGNQEISESFLRDLISATNGETVLIVYQDTEGLVLRMRLETPDISAVVTDPVFSRVQGIECLISRSGSEAEGHLESVTDIRLLGLEESLFSVRMEKGSGENIPSLPAKHIHNVGEMTTEELEDLVDSLGFTIAANAINLVMDLPRIIFDTLIDKLF